MNIAILCGRLAHTPELKALPSGQKVATMSLATNYFYKDQAGQNQQGTDWHNLVAWGRTAENMAQYLKGGDQITVHGSIKTRSYDDKNGGPKRYRTEINIERFEFGAKNMNRDDRRDEGRDDDGYNQDVQGQGYDGPINTPSDNGDINVDDIPF